MNHDEFYDRAEDMFDDGDLNEDFEEALGKDLFLTPTGLRLLSIPELVNLLSPDLHDAIRTAVINAGAERLRDVDPAEEKGCRRYHEAADEGRTEL